MKNFRKRRAAEDDHASEDEEERRNIEETEAAKKLLQDKRFAGLTKSDSSIPSSFSADYFQRGRRQAATDEFMLERFRKRERNRVMRR